MMPDTESFVDDFNQICSLEGIYIYMIGRIEFANVLFMIVASAFIRETEVNILDLGFGINVFLFS